MGERINNNGRQAERVRSRSWPPSRPEGAVACLRRAISATIVALALMSGGVLSVDAHTALAATTFKLESSFGAQGSGTGQFEAPGAVAVEVSTGDAFVLDTKNERIEKFQPTLGTNGYETVGEIAGQSFEFKDDPGLAVDNAPGAYSGDVYVVSGKPKKEAVYQFEPENGSPNKYRATGTRLEGFAEEKVHGLAVGANGYVYVADGTDVSVFSPTGDLVASVSGASSEVQSLAVSNGEVYFATLTRLERLVLNAQYEEAGRTLISTAPTGSVYEGVAVDGKGRVYVDVVYAKEEGKSSVAVFAAGAGGDSAPVAEFGGDGVVQTSDGLAYATPGGVPTVLVSDATDDEVHVFQHTSPEVTGCGATPRAYSTSVTCTVTPDAGQATWKLSYHAPLGGFVEALHGSATVEGEAGGELTGLEPAESYTYELEASNAAGAVDTEGQFETLPVAPVVVASGASGVLQRAATLSGTVDPEHDATFYRFQYGTCTEEASCVTSPFPEEAPESAAGASRGVVSISAAVTELDPATVYHYRIVAVNAGGETVSGEQVFATGAPSRPAVATGSASGVSPTGATILGTVEPSGEATTYTWEFGTSAGYGSTVYGSVGAEGIAESVSLTLTSLLPDTVYHYRLVATNESGIAYGADETFTTSAYGGAPFPIPTSLALVPLPREGAAPPTVAVLPSKEVKLTRAQLLARALKTCRQHKAKSKRVACERQARKRYGMHTPKKK
jgi:hypothetical protein